MANFKQLRQINLAWPHTDLRAEQKIDQIHPSTVTACRLKNSFLQIGPSGTHHSTGPVGSSLAACAV